MSWNGSGVYSLPALYFPEAAGNLVDATRYNGVLNDISSGLNNALTKDGQNAATANLPMGGFKHTGVASSTSNGEYLVYNQEGGRLAELGIGTVPNAGWVAPGTSGAASIDVGATGAVFNNQFSFQLLRNSYTFDNVDYRAKINATATRIIMSPTVITFGYAPSVAADALQTFVNRLTIDGASGDLTSVGNLTAANLSSGSYTPVATLDTNCDSVTPTLAYWFRVGSTVTVFGRVVVDATVDATRTIFSLTLPLASNFSSNSQLAGTFAGQSASSSNAGVVIGESTLDEAQFGITVQSATSVSYQYHYSYVIA